MTPQQVIKFYGGKNESVLLTAIEMAVSPQAVYKWLKTGKVPRLRQYDIEGMTRGKLRADKK